jgi:uncharacterized membrane protein YfcA
MHTLDWIGLLALGFAGGVTGGLLVLVSLVGTWRQWSYGNVRLGDGLVIGLLSPLGVIAGVVLANALSERTLELSFATVQLYFAARLTRRVAFRSAAGSASFQNGGDPPGPDRGP